MESTRDRISGLMEWRSHESEHQTFLLTLPADQFAACEQFPDSHRKRKLSLI